METNIVFKFLYFLSFGLNRTMQYGNIEFSRLTQENKKSLNRTMQYGNFQMEAQKALQNSV